MDAATKWIILLIAFDDPNLPARVLKEAIPSSENEELAAFLRGGELLDVLFENDEVTVERYRLQIERKCLR